MTVKGKSDDEDMKNKGEMEMQQETPLMHLCNNPLTDGSQVQMRS